MMIITTISLLFISILSFRYFSSVYEKDAKASSRYTLDVTSVSFRNHMDVILKNISTFVASTPMLNTLQDIYFNNSEDYINNYIKIQNDLEGLIKSDIFIDDVIIIGKNKEFFALTKYGLKHDISNYFGWDLKNVNGISLLSIRKSPLSVSKAIIPMIIPLSSLMVLLILFHL